MTGMPDFRKGTVPPDVRGPPPSDHDYEANGAIFQSGTWPTQLTKVYTTKRRWRACDVYVDFPNPDGVVNPLSTGILTILIFAVQQVGQVQTRSLVASGRTRPTGANVLAVPEWIAAARSVSLQFEVWVQYSFAGGGQPAIDLNVSVVASDEANDPPPLLGAIRHLPVAVAHEAVDVILSANVAPPVMQFPEVIAVQAAVNPGVAAARYLMLFDKLPGVPAVGSVPLLIWPLGAAPGAGIVDWKVRYRAANGLYLVPSSTALTLTQTADVTLQWYVR